MASNRRLFVLPQLLATLRAMIAEEKGEVTADVTAAADLSKAQATKLGAQYESFDFPSLPGVHINGRAAMGENGSSGTSGSATVPSA